MNCPACGAPMHTEGGSLKCDYCGNVVVPDKDSSGVSVVAESPAGGDACPICNFALFPATLGPSPLLYCTKCHGMLIAMAQFQSLIDAARTASAPIAALPADAHQLDRHINCPHCHHPMDVHFYAGGGNVVMDSCETCSLHWLDHDELARIAQASRPDAIGRDGDSDGYSDSSSSYDSSPDDLSTGDLSAGNLSADDRPGDYQDLNANSPLADIAAGVVDLLARALKNRS